MSRMRLFRAVLIGSLLVIVKYLLSAMKIKQSSVVAPVFRYFKNVSQWLLLARLRPVAPLALRLATGADRPCSPRPGIAKFDPKADLRRFRARPAFDQMV